MTPRRNRRAIDWLQAIVVGLLATHIMTLTGFWQAGLGLNQMDVGAMLAANMDHGYVWGQLAHYLNGIVLAVIYARWVMGLLPGGPFARGLAYGLLTTVAAGIIVAPLAANAGIFFTAVPNPGLMVLSSLTAHLAYGLAVALAYRPEERFLTIATERE
ncbi:MAG: hypothetical protein ABEK03_04540 [Candidatus Bipolaricaulia bacterium]